MLKLTSIIDDYKRIFLKIVAFTKCNTISYVLKQYLTAKRNLGKHF